VRKYNRVFNIIAVFIFVGFLWIITLFLSFSLPKHEDSLKRLLPDDIEVVLSVNADQLIKTLLFDALYKSEFNTNDLKLLSRGSQSEDTQTFGLDVNSEIIMFYDLWNKMPIQGFLFNISSEKDFNQFKLKGNNDIIKTNGQQGVILYLKDNASQELINYATQFAETVISKKVAYSDTTENYEMLSLKYKGNKQSFIKDLKLKASIKDETILIQGSGKKNNPSSSSKEQYSIMTQSPKKKYLEIQSGELPDSLYQYFEFIFDEIGIEVPTVTSQQMMIYGISIENINGSTAFLPKFDWILRFDSIVNVNTKLNALDASSNKLEVIDQKSVKIGGTQYHYQQLSDHEIYIGVTKSPMIESKKMQILPLMRGYPSAVLDIEGRGFVAQFINVMPQVKYSKLFMENVDYFNLQTIDKNASELEIEGEIRLKKGKMMSVELVKFILMFIQ
jgi:hypothetical protein